MIDDMVAWAHARGNRVLHLGGGVGGREDSLFHFKQGFSDWLIPFYTWRIVVDEVRYRQAMDVLAPTGDGGDRSGHFPAYRAPRGSGA